MFSVSISRWPRANTSLHGASPRSRWSDHACQTRQDLLRCIHAQFVSAWPHDCQRVCLQVLYATFQKADSVWFRSTPQRCQIGISRSACRDFVLRYLSQSSSYVTSYIHGSEDCPVLIAQTCNKCDKVLVVIFDIDNKN